jgi:predicted MFS family arabinose efflux permease
LIYTVALVESTLSYFFSPAENALLPRLVGEEQLVAANSMNSMNDNLGRLIGPAIGGALLGVVGFASVIIFDSVSYLIAGILISFVVSPEGKTAETSGDEAAGDIQQIAGGQLQQLWQEFLDGMRLVRNSKILSGVFIVIGIGLFGDAIISALLVPFVQDVVKVGAVEFGWMMTARGLGGLIGGLLLAQIGSRISPTKLLTIGLIISGVLIVAIINFPIYWMVLLGFMLIGIPAVAWLVSIQTILQSSTDEAYLGRIFGAFGTTNTLLMLVGSILGGGLGDLIGAPPLLNSAGLIYILGGVLAIFLLIRPTIKEEKEAALAA